MSRSPVTRLDRWEELFDRDIEKLIAGGTPANTDLQPLRVFVAELRSIADVEISEKFIEFHVAESAATAAAIRSAVASGNRPHAGKTRLPAIRRRVIAVAASLALILGTTGLAWADEAVPGDWYYGLDRALESFGIGNGGATERLQEQQSIADPGSGSEGGEVDTIEGPPVTTEKTTGLDRAAAAVAHAPSATGASEEARARVVDLLKYLNNAGAVDSSVVSEMAKDGAAGPEHAGEPENTGKPENVGPASEQTTATGTGQSERPDNGNGKGVGRP